MAPSPSSVSSRQPLDCDQCLLSSPLIIAMVLRSILIWRGRGALGKQVNFGFTRWHLNSACSFTFCQVQDALLDLPSTATSILCLIAINMLNSQRFAPRSQGPGRKKKKSLLQSFEMSLLVPFTMNAFLHTRAIP